MLQSHRRTLAMVFTMVFLIALGAVPGIGFRQSARAASTLIVTTTADIASPCTPSAFSLR